MINRRTSRFLAAIAALLVLSTVAYAFAASITVPGTNAGSGTGSVGGYVISDIEYTLDAGNHANLDSVDIILNTAATYVEARISGTGTWVTCTGGPGTDWSCPVGGTVLVADSLQVLAFTNYP
jgi:hypothetical protein